MCRALFGAQGFSPADGMRLLSAYLVDPRSSVSCRVRSCSNADRSTRRVRLASPSSPCRSFRHQVSTASNDGTRPGDVVSVLAREWYRSEPRWSFNKDNSKPKRFRKAALAIGNCEPFPVSHQSSYRPNHWRVRGRSPVTEAALSLRSVESEVHLICGTTNSRKHPKKRFCCVGHSS